MSLLTQASLVITPSAYKEGKLYSVIPSDGSGDLSVTRATTATRVNSAGLVELVPYNLLQYSQDFSNAYWFGEPGNTITSNTTTAPDGTLTADTFTATSGNSMNVHNFNGFSLADGTFTYSIYLKNNGTNLIEAYLFKVGVGFAARGEINFSAGTFTASIGTGSIENVGNGWYRVSLTNTYTSGTFTTGTFTTSTTGTRSVFAWGAQLVEGSVAKDYQKTETRLNIPRLDYSNGTCPSILVEPQRTNLATWSNDFSNAVWTKNQSTITSNYAVSPQGIQNASRWLSNSGATLHFLSQLYGFTLGQTYTISCYVKSNTSSNQDFRLGIDGGVTSSNLTATTEWQRFTFTASPTNAVGLTAFFIARPSTNAAVDLLIYGLQLELGSYATSYIPTTSASVTRNADVISKTGIADLIGQTEGTLFVDVYRESLSSQICVFLSNSTGVNAYFNSIYIFQIPNNYLTIDCFVSNVGQFSIQTGANLSVGRHKIAVAYKQNDAVVYIDGVLFGSDNSCNIPPMSVLDLNPIDTAVSNNAEFNSVVLWKTRLTNTQLAQLTTI